MTIRQAVVFAILMQHGEGIIGKFPKYVREKLECCQQTNVPEQLLDGPGLALFRSYAERFEFDWNSSRDYHDVPAGNFDEVTGEAILGDEE